jgi:hypothetical protein
MKPGEIFAKTMPFVWAKLLLGLAVIVASIVIFAILMGIAYLIKSEMFYFIMFIIWLSATGAANFFLKHYIGYLVKAGHIAVIAEAVTGGKVPNNQVKYGMGKVKERFLESNVYFVIDKLVAGAVKQLQRAVEKVAGLGSFIPGMNYITNIAKMFIGIALGYIDECCLGWTFLKKDQGAFKSACDGVVIYAQNWKQLLKDAAKTTAIVVILVAAITLLSFIIFFSLFRLFGWQGALGQFVAFLLAVFTAVAVKGAFIDSYILVKMMFSYIEVAPNTKITVDIYNNLCGLSSKFKELFAKGQQESGFTPKLAPAAAGGRSKKAATVAKDKLIFCGECGAKNERGKKFCSECGKLL